MMEREILDAVAKHGTHEESVAVLVNMVFRADSDKTEGQKLDAFCATHGLRFTETYGLSASGSPEAKIKFMKAT